MTIDEIKNEAHKLYGDGAFVMHNPESNRCTMGWRDDDFFYVYAGGLTEEAMQNALTRKLCGMKHEVKARYKEVMEGLALKSYILWCYYPGEGFSTLFPHNR